MCTYIYAKQTVSIDEYLFTVSGITGYKLSDLNCINFLRTPYIHYCLLPKREFCKYVQLNMQQFFVTW